MEFFDCVMGRRTCRRFKQDPVGIEDLRKMVDAARYAPTGYNNQPTRYVIISSPAKVAEAFKFTGWLTGRPGEDETPAAYIAVVRDNTVSKGPSAGACAAYAIQLAAHALGYSTCWHGAGGREGFKEFLGLAESLEPAILVSIGRAAEKVVVHDPSDDWKVRKDDDGTIHLGKLGRDKVVLAEM